MAITVIIADDHPVVRDGLRLTIERKAGDIEIVGEAADGNDVIELAKRQPADVYILDITMPGLNGMEVTRRLIEMDGAARVIILSLHGGQAFVEQALESGAMGYVAKESATRDVIDAVREVYKGNRFLSPDLSAEFSSTEAGAPAARRKPTPREREVLLLIAQGCTSRDIADKIGVALNTVQVHRKNLMGKLDIHKETDLVRYAVREGMVKP